MGLEELDRMRPEVREKYLDMVRSLPAGRKFKQVFEYSDLVRGVMVKGIRDQYPGISEERLIDELRKRILPADLYARLSRATGGDASEHA